MARTSSAEKPARVSSLPRVRGAGPPHAWPRQRRPRDHGVTQYHQPASLALAPQLARQPGSAGRIESGAGLVEEQDFRLVQQGARQR